MFGIVNYGGFLVSSIALNITPGADTVYVLGNSVNGKKQGLLSALGISAGCFVHTLLAAFGLSVLLSRSAFLFQAVKTVGAVYLLFLGIRSFFAKTAPAAVSESSLEGFSAKRVFFRGMLTNVLNPKVALFFLAFLPQFIDRNSAFSPLAFLLLGISFITTGFFWLSFLVCICARIVKKAGGTWGLAGCMHKVSGVVFICLGLSILLGT